MKTQGIPGFVKVLIIVGILVIVIGSGFGMAVSSENRAITMEEQIGQFHSNLGAQYQRRFDLYTTLAEAIVGARGVDELFIDIARARSAANAGDFNEAESISQDINMAINVVMEAYPDLRSHDSFLHFQTEASLTENQMARYRESFNNAVRQYRQFVRRFPNRMFLGWMGYEVIDFQFLQFEQQGQGPPTGLFN